jgi:hypothetical protein
MESTTRCVGTILALLSQTFCIGRDQLKSRRFIFLALCLFVASSFSYRAHPATATTVSIDQKGDAFLQEKSSPAAELTEKTAVLDENFLAMAGKLDPQITFSRASSATFVGRNGLIQRAAVNAPRFDYDPTTLELNGLLLEQGSTNQQLDSSFNIFPGGIYRWYGSQALLTFESALGPDGSTSAAMITDNSVSGLHEIHYANGVFPTGVNPKIPFYAWPAGGPQVETCSMFFKAGTLSFARLALYENATESGVAVDIDLHTGTLAHGGTIGSGATYLGSSIKAYNSGIYRVSVSGIIPDPHNLSCDPFTEDSIGDPSYVGDGGTISVWGADLENSSMPSSYLYTASVPNLQLDSNDFSNWDSGEGTSGCGNGFACNSVVTTNAAIAPDGTLTAAQLADDAHDGNHLTNHPFGLGGPALIANDGEYYATVTCSEFFKERTQRYAQLQCGTEGSSFVNGEVNSGISVDIDLQNGTIANGGTYGVTGSDQTTYLGSSIEALPNPQFPNAPAGWYRVSVTGTVIVEADVHLQSLLANSLGTISYIGTGSSIFIWGPQVEQHQTPTLSDYVPVGQISVGAATRAPEVATQPLIDHASRDRTEREAPSVEVPPNFARGISWIVSGITAPGNSATQIAAELDDGSAHNRIVLQRTLDSHLQFLIVSGGVKQSTLDLGAVGNGTAFRAGFSAIDGLPIASLDGNPIVYGSGHLPARLTTVRYGSDTLGDYWNGWLRQSEIWCFRMSNTQLRAAAAKAP